MHKIQYEIVYNIKIFSFGLQWESDSCSHHRAIMLNICSSNYKETLISPDEFHRHLIKAISFITWLCMNSIESVVHIQCLLNLSGMGIMNCLFYRFAHWEIQSKMLIEPFVSWHNPAQVCQTFEFPRFEEWDDLGETREKRVVRVIFRMRKQFTKLMLHRPKLWLSGRCKTKVVNNKNLLLSFCCMRIKSSCFNPWKFSTPVFRSPTPGIWFRDRKASPAKSFAVITSWSITVNAIIAFSWLHCSVVIVPNSKHSSNIGFRVRCWNEANGEEWKKMVRLLKKVYLGLWKIVRELMGGKNLIPNRWNSFFFISHQVRYGLWHIRHVYLVNVSLLLTTMRENSTRKQLNNHKRITEIYVFFFVHINRINSIVSLIEKMSIYLKPFGSKGITFDARNTSTQSESWLKYARTDNVP